MSDTKKNRSTVDIYGQQYTIVGSESTSHIRLIASMVDDKMREIGSANPSLDTSKLAVLTAVNAVNDYIKMKDRVESLEAEIKRLKD
ncbi:MULTISPECIES: cell division protein ZapA [Bacillaceae]|uniref:Cell division protein ZapA n=1 Tax=Mesobacillus jeotgali TaxID=129985 RepID=A0ABY9VMT5_9BACI|nr:MULTISPECIES: cell division protein ZapA [Bacillaceae]MBT2638543.1 cell division protein ZapA [Bacillus sp. ISL-39]MBT2660549.1 cell division protein ZapA [Bacillus sp. ISL-45]MCM3572133.1 cell division protein ZapA [Mesobacillus subterraneus]UYZ24460.1 cell division protein ZapA [Mesobacillus jeotgali]WNF25256.1 cell division protein ZapA [Mesobacillus jeotgali]